MKQLLCSLMLLFLAAIPAYSQSMGRIDSLRVMPANPTSADTIKVVAYCWFAYSGCAPTTTWVNEQMLTGTVSHCLGIMAATCNSIDTFYLAPRTPGAYRFKFNLLTASQPTCSPVLVSDVDSASFIVTRDPAGIGEQNSRRASFNAYYSWGQVFISSLPPAFSSCDVRIISMAGQVIAHKQAWRNNMPLDIPLSTGVYVISITHNQQQLVGRLTVN